MGCRVTLCVCVCSLLSAPLLTRAPHLSSTILNAAVDKKHGPTWHVVVGRNFGSYVTHETKHFIYFYLGQVAVLLFKSG